MIHILDILLPKTCLSCNREGLFLCPECREAINEYKYFICPVCKRRNVDGRLDESCREASGLTRYFGSPLPYANETVRKMIHAFKYRYAKDLAEPLSRVLVEFLEKNNFAEFLPKNRTRLLLVPVPLANFRERERGFNQATEIATHLGRHFGFAHSPCALEKPKHTTPQADAKTKEAREKNVAGAYVCPNPALVSGKTVILIDDVYTTGATMRECATTLRKSGAAQIWGITLARG